MQRYFVDKKNNNTFTLSEKDSYHLKTVMRKKENDNIEIVYNNDTYICEVIELNPSVKCNIISVLDNIDSNMCSVTIAQSLVKEQKMDYILQKSCEMGIDYLIPLNTTRCVVKLDSKEDKKIKRWQTIFEEASSQSKRNRVPIVLPISNIKDLIKQDYDYKLLCTVNETSTNIKKVLSNIKTSDTILVVVGPEGGFTNEEEEIFINNGFISVSLGDRILRTESVSLFILSIINYIFMR